MQRPLPKYQPSPQVRARSAQQIERHQQVLSMYESLEAGCVPVVIAEFGEGIEVQLRPLLQGGRPPFLYSRTARELASRKRRCER